MSKVLYFSAEWCGPCRAMAPIIEKFLEDNEDAVITKIDADEESELVIQHKVSSIPTFILLSDSDEEINRHRGAMNANAFAEFVNGE